MEAFLEVGTALTKIRDTRLYKAEFRTFEDYCRQRWDMTRQYANQLISSVHVVNSLETIVSKPTAESQVRPLSQLPTRERSAAWEEAVRSAPNGKPTAAKVQEVVNSRLATINGQYAADPPDVAKARENGKIPHDAIVTVEEPDEPTTQEEIAEEHEEAKAQTQDEMGDDDWFATLPLAAVLTGNCLKTFRIDALFWRATEKAREHFKHTLRLGQGLDEGAPGLLRLASFQELHGNQSPERVLRICVGFQRGWVLWHRPKRSPENRMRELPRHRIQRRPLPEAGKKMSTGLLEKPCLGVTWKISLWPYQLEAIDAVKPRIRGGQTIDIDGTTNRMRQDDHLRNDHTAHDPERWKGFDPGAPNRAYSASRREA